MSLRANGSYLGASATGPTTALASGIWSLRDAERYKRDGEWPAAPSAGVQAGDLYAVGKNSTGQLGDGSTTDRASAVQIGTAQWTSLAASQGHTLGIKADGTLHGWGENAEGAVGDGTTTNRTSPTQVGTDLWSVISAAYSHKTSAGIKDDGTLWAWGYNTTNNVGDGTTTNRSSPVLIGGSDTWSTVAMRDSGGAALRSDGTLWGWGLNSVGQVGDGTTTTRTTPTQAGIDTDWSALAAGNAHYLALKSDGTLWTWGYGAQGQTVSGATTTLSPTQIGTDTWAAIGAGYQTSYGIKTDGTLWAWGAGTNYGLGNSSTSNQTTPVQLGSDTDWSSVDSGRNYALALKTGGELYGWGRNDYGQADDGGGTTDIQSPTQISSGTSYVGFSCGFYHSLRLRA